jgi:hypothetical protein
MPIFMAFLSAYPLSNRLANGTTDDLPGYTKRLCVWLCNKTPSCNATPQLVMELFKLALAVLWRAHRIFWSDNPMTPSA